MATDKYGFPILVRANKIVVIDGALKCIRLGHLTPRDQTIGPFKDRAPEKKGIWAFPFPYFDMFFAYHKYSEVVPKHLLGIENESWEDYYEYLEENDPETLNEFLDYSREITKQREEWIKAHKKVMPRKTFFWRGNVWAKFDKFGRMDNPIVRWHLLTMDEYENAARRVEPNPVSHYYKDHMEIFLATKQGKVI